MQSVRLVYLRGMKALSFNRIAAKADLALHRPLALANALQ
jgi:hypothetical protein